MKRSILITLAGLLILWPFLNCFAAQIQTKSITAQNTFTTKLLIHQHGTVRISGSPWSATVTLQRSEDNGSTWVDTGDTWTSNGVYPFTDYTNQYYRVGVKTGEFTSGTISVWIGDSQ